MTAVVGASGFARVTDAPLDLSEHITEVSSHAAGAVWEPMGGVRVADPVELPAAVVAAAKAAGYPGLDRPLRPGETERHARTAWRLFARDADPSRIGD